MQQYHSGCNNFPEKKKKKRTTVRCRKLKRNKLGLGACKRGTLLGGGGRQQQHLREQLAAEAAQ